MPATVGRKVRAVIEIESAEVVLVRLALAAVLADDDARHRLEHLAGAHHRPRVELSAGDGALTGRLGDARPGCAAGSISVGQVGEGPLAGHRDVGAEHQVERGVGGDGTGRGHDEVRAARWAKLARPEGDAATAPGRGRLEVVAPRQRRSATRAASQSPAPEFDDDSRQRPCRFRRSPCPSVRALWPRRALAVASSGDEQTGRAGPTTRIPFDSTCRW